MKSLTPKKEKVVSPLVFGGVILGLILLGLGVFSAMTTVPVYAAECNTVLIPCDESGKGSIYNLVELIINIASVAAGVLAAIGITVVGIQYLTAGGNEEKTRKAKRRMLEIVIGLAVYAVFAAILNWLLPNFNSGA